MRAFRKIAIIAMVPLFVGCIGANFYTLPKAAPSGPSVKSNIPIIDITTPPVINTGKSGCVQTAGVQDFSPLVTFSGYFGRPVQILTNLIDNVANAQHACQSYANIIETLSGNNDPAISLDSTCSRFQDVMEVQFNFKIHSDQLQRSGDFVEFCQSNTVDPVSGQLIPLPLSTGRSAITNLDRSVTAPDDCITKEGFINYYAGGGMAGYVTQARCDGFQGNTSNFIVRVTKP